MKKLSPLGIKEFLDGSHAANCCTQLLLLEDDALLREALAEAFSARGYCVQALASLHELRTHNDLAPSHALIDLRLQGECGLDALAYVKELIPSCQVIIFTGFGSIATAVRAIQLGALNYVLKPASVEEIEEAFGGSPVQEAQFATRCKLHEHQREYIEKILQDFDGNISRAARILGIHRQSLQRMLRKFT